MYKIVILVFFLELSIIYILVLLESKKKILWKDLEELEKLFFLNIKR